MDSLKILHVCSSRAWGGMEMQAVQLASQLEKRDHEVLVLCYPESPILKASHKKGVPCVAIALDSYFQPFMTLRLIRFLQERNFDIVHCHYTKDLWHLIPSVERAGDGCVILSKGVGPGKRKIDPVHRWLYKNVQCLIAKSEYLHRRVIEAYPIDPQKVVTLNNGVELSEFDPKLHSGRVVRKNLGIRERDLLVGIVGRITPAKGHKEFLKAAGNVSRRLPNSAFLIVGGCSPDESWYENEIRRLAGEIGLGDKVIFTGHREDIPALLSTLDVFVLSSYMEAFPNVLIEAMAMGKACVATRAGGVLDVVEDGTCGLLVPPRDVGALTETLLLLLENEEARVALGKAARRRIEERFDLRIKIVRLEELYFQTLNGERLKGKDRRIKAQ